MKREDVKAIFPDATDEQLDKIMGINGADINKAKGDLDKVKTELEKAKTDLAEAKKGGGEELTKAQTEIGKLQKELGDLKTANAVRDIRAKVAKDKGISDPSLLTADTEEGCTEQADKLLAFAKAQNPTGYPSIPDGGSVGTGTSSSRQKFADWAKDQI